MKVLPGEKELLQSIQIEDFGAYLRSRSWHAVPSGNDFAELWIREGGDSAPELLVPKTRTFRDYALRIQQALSLLEEVEQRSKVDIIRDLVLTNADVIRLIRPTYHQDAIALRDGVRLVKHAMELMTSAASSAIAPRPVVPSRRPPQAQDYLNKVSMGQTERGSYVLTIVSKLTRIEHRSDAILFPELSEPFQRKVTKTLARSLSALTTATSAFTANGDVGAFVSAIPDGVSANLCEAVEGMVQDEEFQGEIGISITWASTTPRESSAELYSFGPNDGPILGIAARHLRATEPVEAAIITGVVIKLQRSEGETSGIATVACVIEGMQRRLQVPLPLPQYTLAVQAHRDKEAVMFKADIHKEGRQYTAANVRDFRVVLPSEVDQHYLF